MSERPNLILLKDDDTVPVVDAPPATIFIEDSARKKHRVNSSNGNVEIDGNLIRLDTFLHAVKHVLTASNVPKNDPRHAFVAYVQDLTLVSGFGGSGQRFAPEDE